MIGGGAPPFVAVPAYVNPDFALAMYTVSERSVNTLPKDVVCFESCVTKCSWSFQKCTPNSPPTFYPYYFGALTDGLKLTVVLSWTHVRLINDG